MSAPGVKGTTWLRVEFDFLVSDVAGVVLQHNLYPSSFRRKEHKALQVVLEDRPFAYLAMLADSLQEWDREMLASTVSLGKPVAVPGGRFGIEVCKDTIKIYVRSPYPISLAEVEKRFRETPSLYLRHAGSYVKFSVVES